MTADSVRLDQWLNAARIFKARTQAQKACISGRVRLNDSTAKPHSSVSVDDRVDIRFGDWTRKLIVRGLAEKPIAKALARELYEDVSPPRPRQDPIDRILYGGSEHREKGKGRPTKRERREIERLKKKHP